MCGRTITHEGITLRNRLALAVGGAVAVTTAVIGCSNGTSAQTSETTADKASSPPTSLYSGTTTIIADGKTLVADAPTLCNQLPDAGVAINIGLTDADRRGIILKGDPPTVDNVVLGNVNGSYVTYVDSMKSDGWRAIATKNGNQYTVSLNYKGETQYRIDATCP